MSARSRSKNPNDQTKEERLDAMKRDLARWDKVKAHLRQFERDGEGYARVEIYGHPSDPTIQPVTGA